MVYFAAFGRWPEACFVFVEFSQSMLGSTSVKIGHSVFGAALLASSLALVAQPAAATTVDFYGAYTVTETPVSPVSGDNLPSIGYTGLVGYAHSSPPYFEVVNLVAGGAAAPAYNDPTALLFSVNPASCISGSGHSCSRTGTETVDITVNFTFYSKSGSTYTSLGTMSDTALATFNYTTQEDNICWTDSAVSGSAVVNHTSVPTCNPPKPGGSSDGYEQVEVDLGGLYYNVNLYDWSDWNEQPDIKFQLLNGCVGTGCPGLTNTGVPEPLSLSLFGAGLAGTLAMRRRKKAA